MQESRVLCTHIHKDAIRIAYLIFSRFCELRFPEIEPEILSVTIQHLVFLRELSLCNNKLSSPWKEDLLWTISSSLLAENFKKLKHFFFVKSCIWPKSQRDVLDNYSSGVYGLWQLNRPEQKPWVLKKNLLPHVDAKTYFYYFLVSSILNNKR